MKKDQYFKLENLQKKLEMAKNAAEQQNFMMEAPETYRLNIRSDKKITPAKFISDPFIPGGYKAHPQTIAAMRGDIFAAGEELFEDLEYLYKCESCKQILDLQFWKFCPFCECSFPKDLPAPVNRKEVSKKL